MPLYSYRCGAGHETTWLGRFEERPAFVGCGCGQSALLGVGLPSVGLVRGGTDGGKGIPPRDRGGFVEERPGVWVKGASVEVKLVAWGCGGCGKKAWDDAVPVSCPSCGGATMEREVEWGRDWWDAEGFSSSGGYFDRGAGRWFSSREERRAWAEANGMTEVAGVNDDTDAIVRKESERLSAMDEFWRGEFRERDSDPEYARMLAEGKVPDDQWVRELVGYRG